MRILDLSTTYVGNSSFFLVEEGYLRLLASQNQVYSDAGSQHFPDPAFLYGYQNNYEHGRVRWWNRTGVGVPPRCLVIAECIHKSPTYAYSSGNPWLYSLPRKLVKGGLESTFQLHCEHRFNVRFIRNWEMVDTTSEMIKTEINNGQYNYEMNWPKKTRE